MKIVEIYSGGLDSTVLYFHLKKQDHQVTCMNFSYGSTHNRREREAARAIVPDLVEVDIDLSLLKSALIAGNNQEIPEGHYTDKSMQSTVVPFRNGIMLSYAAAYAESEQMEAVAFANHAGDHAIYPDCRTEFVETFRAAARAGTYQRIELISPFVGMNKTEIVRLGLDLGIKEQLFRTWSCYKGGEIHCGRCGTCVERREAFRLAGIKDRTIYES